MKKIVVDNLQISLSGLSFDEAENLKRSLRLSLLKSISHELELHSDQKHTIIDMINANPIKIKDDHDFLNLSDIIAKSIIGTINKQSSPNIKEKKKDCPL